MRSDRVRIPHHITEEIYTEQCLSRAEVEFIVKTHMSQYLKEDETNPAKQQSFNRSIISCEQLLKRINSDAIPTSFMGEVRKIPEISNQAFYHLILKLRFHTPKEAIQFKMRLNL